MTILALITLPLADSDGWGMHGAGWAPMMIGMVLFWGAIILGVVWLVRNTTNQHRERHQQTAVEILDRRFAEGAISLDDYHQRMNVLASAGSRHGEDITLRESERN
jgi:putative membrane protein